MSKDGKAIGERVAVLETRTDGIEVRMKTMDEISKTCRELQAVAIGSINLRLNTFVNHEVTKLREEIADAKNTRREPLQWKEKAAIIIAILASFTAIAGQLISYFAGR